MRGLVSLTTVTVVDTRTDASLALTDKFTTR
jgi:hypothetical protein